MYETYVNGISDTNGNTRDKDMLADEKGSGYTMAHEWAHYYLGLYDEYVLRATDVAVNPSIMSEPMEGQRRRQRLVEFLHR